MGSKTYDARFGPGRRAELGLISDISASQEHPWHRHYRYEEIRALADDSLETQHVEIVYPGMRAIWCLAILWRALFHCDPAWTRPLTTRLSCWKTKGATS